MTRNAPQSARLVAALSLQEDFTIVHDQVIPFLLANTHRCYLNVYATRDAECGTAYCLAGYHAELTESREAMGKILMGEAKPAVVMRTIRNSEFLFPGEPDLALKVFGLRNGGTVEEDILQRQKVVNRTLERLEEIIGEELRAHEHATV